MEWVPYLLGALVVTQVILILMAAERRSMLVEVVEATRPRTLTYRRSIDRDHSR